MNIISTTYLFDPNLYNLYWISIIPIITLLYIIKSGNKSLLTENIILSIICGAIPFIVITRVIMDNTSVFLTGTAQTTLFLSMMSDEIILFSCTQITTLMTLSYSIYTKIKHKN